MTRIQRSALSWHRRALAGAVACLLVTTAGAQGAETTGAAAFEMLKGLSGTWEGTAADGEMQFPAQVVYRLASNGTVVMETLFPGTEHEMISMYHLDGESLVMTHYCAIGNQPRMRLDLSRSTPDHLVLAFDGGTNLDPKKDGHIHAGEVALRPGGALHAEWIYFDQGKEQGTKKLDLHRKP